MNEDCRQNGLWTIGQQDDWATDGSYVWAKDISVTRVRQLGDSIGRGQQSIIIIRYSNTTSIQHLYCIISYMTSIKA